MGVITTTFGLTSKASGTSPAADAGPLSVALSLSATDSITITKVAEAGTAAVTTTHTDNLIFDASTMNEVYIYLNNVSDTTVYVTNADAGTDANRFMALRAGEFAWFPWFAASTGTATDIYLDHSASGTKDVEYWVFQV